MERVHPDDGKRLEATMGRHQRQRSPYQIELRIRHRTGSYIWIRSRGQSVWDEDGTLLRTIGTIEDISDRKAADLTIQESQQRYQDLINTVPGIVWEANPDTLQLTFISSQAVAMSGYALEEWTAPGFWVNHLHEEDRDAAVQACMEASVQGQDHTLHYRLIHADGHPIWIEDFVQVTMQDGEILRLRGLMVDISDRKQAEFALRESEAFRRQLTDLAPIPIFVFDLDQRRVTFCNQAYEESLGYSLSEIWELGDDYLPTIYHPDTLANIEAHDRAILRDRDGRIHETEYACCRKDGSKVFVFSREVVISYNADGVPHLILGFAIDITKRKQMEEELQRSNTLYTSLTDAMPQFLYRKDRQGQVTYTNPSLQRWMGMSEQELLGVTVYDTFPYELAAKYDADDRHVLETGEILDKIEIHKTPSKDDELHVQVVKSPIRDGEGNIVGTQGIFWDVTDRIALEQSLRESETRLSVILNSSAAAILNTQFLSDRTYYYDYASDSCQVIFGYSTQEILDDARLLWSRVHPDDIENHVIPSFEAVISEQSFQFEYRFRHKDGQWRWLMLSANSRWDADKNSWQVTQVHTDISDRKQLELNLRHRETELRQAQAIAHIGSWDMDLRTGQCSWSNELYRIYGATPQTAIETYLIQRVHPDDQIIYKTEILSAIEQHQLFKTDLRILTLHDEVRYVEARGEPVFDEHGVPIQFIGTVLDITARKTAEIALRQRQRLLDIFFSQALEGCFFMMLDQPIEWTDATDKDAALTYVFEHQRITRANDAILAQYGLTREQFLGMRPCDFFAHDLEQGRSVWRQFFDAGHLHIETDERRQDGTLLVIEGDYVCMYDEDGRIIGHFGIQRDITERKQTELALAQREQEFRTLAENSPDCIMRCDRQNRFIYVNPAVVEITGIPAGDYIGKTSQALGFPDFLIHLWHNAIDEVFATGKDKSLEYTLPSIQGDRTFFSYVVPERQLDGSIPSLLVVARDITNLKQLQQDLLLQAERERILYTITQHIRQSLDIGEILQTSVDEVRQLLNADRVAIYRFLPNGSGQIISESVQQPWISMLGTVLRDPCFTGTLINQYRNGKVHQVSDRYTANLQTCYSDVLASFQVRASLVVPITDGKDLWGLFFINYCADRHLWQSWEVELLQRLTDQLTIAIQQSELYHQIQGWADTLEQQVEERTAEIQHALHLEATLKRITDRVRDSLDEDQILEAAVEELGRSLKLECCDTGIYNSELTVSTIAHEFTRSLSPAQGLSFPIAEATHSEIYPMLFDGISVQFCDFKPSNLRPERVHLTVLACTIQDDQSILGDIWLMKASSESFTELEVRLAEQVANQCAIALRQARLFEAAQAQVVELERLNTLKDDFLSTVSHELRTPMASIKMATEMIEIYLQRLQLLNADDDRAPATEITGLRQYFRILKDEGQREISLINDLLDLTRIEAHSEPLNLTTIPLQTWIPHCVETWTRQAEHYQLSLTTHIPLDLPPVTTDLSYLQRILSELVNNACKYTPPHESIAIAIQGTTDLEIRVSNSGIEILPEEQDRIFDRFYRIPNSDPWRYEGTGLGLALVKKLVEYLGGTINVESRDRQTCFIIHLPFEPPAKLTDSLPEL